LAKPIINQGVVSFRDPSGNINDEWNERVIAEIAREGTSFFSGTTFKARRAMRISVSNWQTSQEDVARTLEGVKRALTSLSAAAGGALSQRRAALCSAGFNDRRGGELAQAVARQDHSADAAAGT